MRRKAVAATSAALVLTRSAPARWLPSRPHFSAAPRWPSAARGDVL